MRALRRRFGDLAVTVEGAPDVKLALAPEEPRQVAAVLQAASQRELSVVPWGGGTHQGYGGRVAPAQARPAAVTPGRSLRRGRGACR